MKKDDSNRALFSRRRFLGATGAALASAGVKKTLGEVAATSPASPQAIPNAERTIPFWGRRQAGILTPCQSHTYFAVFDLITSKREEVKQLFQQWTAATAQMSQRAPSTGLTGDPQILASDSGEVLGLSPAHLTITFGLGPGLFVKDGQDRFGLASKRPAELIDLPRFNGDQLIEATTGGDISVQACADDPQVAFHAIRQLVRLADGVAQVRWAQTGFIGGFAPKVTPRNLMGFKDGTGNPSPDDAALMNQFVWCGDDGPAWMKGGTYMVVRRVRMALEHWDRMPVDFQEQAVGRQKLSGAGIGAKNEIDPVDLNAADKDGNSLVPDNSHVRLAMPASNDGARILRRSYSYNDGVNFTSERWPPWRQGMEYDAGLLFICYQRDVRSGFVKIFDTMSKLDVMNQFLTHTGSGVFACPPGAVEGEFVGQGLF